jgi:hypothetical protein
MAFCRKCGAAMAEDDLVCAKCGTRINNAKDDLIDKLVKYKQLLSENEELDTMIRPQSEFPTSDESGYKKRSFIRYFWPFLAGAVGGGYLVYFLFTIVTVMSMSNAVLADQDVASRAMGDSMLGIIVALIVAGGIVFIGIKISKRKQDEFNSNADYMSREISERYQKGLLNEKMVRIYQENINNMRQYERIVPEPYRSSAKVGSIINILNEDKAQSVEEAILLLG